LPDDAYAYEDLTALYQITQRLNHAPDVRGVLDEALAHLVRLMGLETGWIFLADPTAQERWWGQGFTLGAAHNLPPALALESAEAWDGDCDCQGLCRSGGLQDAYNEVRCSRLGRPGVDRRGLAVHASAPLQSGGRTLGILNVAGPEWPSFSPRALALLSNVGSQIGIALERAQLFDMLQEQRVREQAALLEFSNQLLGRGDLDDLIGYLTEEVRQLVKVDACALLLPADEPGMLVFQAASGWRTDPVTRQWRVPADETSGAGLVLASQRPLLVADLEEEDPTSWRPEWLCAEEFRGHAVMPLIADGNSVGVLLINTRRPGLLDADKVRFLRLVANQAALAIETARLHRDEIRRQQFERELAVGRQIQIGLLPKSCPEVPGWDCAAEYRAARVVGGDFYDFFELPGEPGRLGVVIADVADKGVPAALLMALSRTMIRTTAISGYGPAEALMRANELILQECRSGLFLSAFYAVIDTRQGRLIYANAGHDRPLWYRAGEGRFTKLRAAGIVLGAFERIELEEKEIQLAPEDFVLFYTDGVTDAMNGRSGEMFGAERFLDAAASRPSGSAQEILEGVLTAIEAFAEDGPQSDDLTLFVIKRAAPVISGLTGGLPNRV
jgi:sigma-B regulation protein RsbU (phosphoserine phosphatase)